MCLKWDEGVLQSFQELQFMTMIFDFKESLGFYIKSESNCIMFLLWEYYTVKSSLLI